MNNYIKEQVKAHAMKEYPNECCGLIVISNTGVITVYPCKNEARNGKSRFSIDPKEEDDAKKFGEIVAFYHSHMDEVANPQRDKFTTEDLDIAYEACLPALLYVYPQDSWHYVMPDTYRPVELKGRPFVWGVWDCYCSVRDWFLVHRKVKLDDFFAPEEGNLRADFGYEKHIANCKYLEEIPVEQLAEGDIIIFKINSQFCNHSAVYLGYNQFFHQPINKTSSTTTLDDRYLKYIAKVLRYKV